MRPQMRKRPRHAAPDVQAAPRTCPKQQGRIASYQRSSRAGQQSSISSRSCKSSRATAVESKHAAPDAQAAPQSSPKRPRQKQVDIFRYQRKRTEANGDERQPTSSGAKWGVWGCRLGAPVSRNLFTPHAGQRILRALTLNYLYIAIRALTLRSSYTDFVAFVY